MPLPRAAALPVERVRLQPQPCAFVPNLGKSKHGPLGGNHKSRLLQNAGATGAASLSVAGCRRGVGRRKGERWLPVIPEAPGPVVFLSRRTERLGESVLLRSRRKWGGGVSWPWRRRYCGAACTGPSPRCPFCLPSARFPQPVCLCGHRGGGVPCVFRCCSWVVSPSSSSAARWRRLLLLLLEPGIRRAPHSQGGPLAAEAQTQGVQPSYSRAKFSRRVASLIMYSTCSATLERLVLSGSRPSSFIFTRRQTPTA